LIVQVALKRIPDVLSSPEQAKRVLREVCILRRLKHPFLINLRDAFTRPATCGKQSFPAQTTHLEQALQARGTLCL
jgi:mitogen-activated protein kinase 1/3